MGVFPLAVHAGLDANSELHAGPRSRKQLQASKNRPQLVLQGQ